MALFRSENINRSNLIRFPSTIIFVVEAARNAALNKDSSF
jgi:hypothetical protein